MDCKDTKSIHKSIVEVVYIQKKRALSYLNAL